MPVIKFAWHSGPPADPKPAMHVTCLTNEAYHAARWWDGARWWDVVNSRGKKDNPFIWPAGFKKGTFARWSWMWGAGRHLSLRNITDQAKVRYGVPYKHFEPDEVIKYLVNTGRLPKDWKECFQQEMRNTK